jgi:hypothetical protein
VPFNAEPWKEVMPRKCKVVGGAAPLSTGTGALLALLVIGYAVLELDKRVPR